MSRFVEVMLQTSVVFSRMQVMVGASRPADKFVKMPRQWGSPCAIL